MKNRTSEPTNLVISLILLFLLLGCLLAFGQEADTDKQYSTVSFDLRLPVLPPTFQGHDLAKLYSVLEQRSLSSSKKDEFETTEEYSERIRAEQTKVIIDSLFANSVYAFKARDCKPQYDADKQTFFAQCKLSPFAQQPSLRSDFPRNIKAVSWRFESKDLGSYTGTNAFGVSAEVSRSQLISYNIAIHNWDEFPLEEVIDKDDPLAPFLDKKKAFLLQMELPPAKAKLLKPSISALFVCTLAPPFVSKFEDYSAATLDNPLSVIYTTYYVHARLVEVWFYNETTGEVLKKIKED